MNDYLPNGYVSSGIGLLNIHTIPQDNLSSKLNVNNTSVDNGDFNGDYCYTNGSTVSVINNHNLVDYKNKIDAIYTNRYLRENKILPDGVDIDDMSLAYSLNQYVNM